MKIALNSLGKKLGSSIDLFICSSSFEDRCRAIPESLDPSAIKRTLICENQDYESYAIHNTKKLIKHFGRRAHKIVLRTDNPLLVADNLQTALSKALRLRPSLCVVDMTTFTHEGLLILIRVLNQSGFSGDLRFVYAGAKDYSLNSSKSEKWLSKGIDNVRSVLGYPGVMLPSKRLHLIVLVGFESERAENLIEAYEPAAISLGLGDEAASVSRNHYATNADFHQKVLSFVRSIATQNTTAHSFTFSCVDPFDAREALRKHISKFPDYNTVVAPMNTKISTLGAALVALENDCIQLCYAHATQYNIASYSSPSNDCRMFDGREFLRRVPQGIR